MHFLRNGKIVAKIKRKGQREKKKKKKGKKKTKNKLETLKEVLLKLRLVRNRRHPCRQGSPYGFILVTTSEIKVLRHPVARRSSIEIAMDRKDQVILIADRMSSGGIAAPQHILRVTGAAGRTGRKSHQMSEDARLWGGERGEVELTMIHLSVSRLSAFVGCGLLS